MFISVRGERTRVTGAVQCWSLVGISLLVFVHLGCLGWDCYIHQWLLKLTCNCPCSCSLFACSELNFCLSGSEESRRWGPASGRETPLRGRPHPLLFTSLLQSGPPLRFPSLYLFAVPICSSVESSASAPLLCQNSAGTCTLLGRMGGYSRIWQSLVCSSQ